MTLDQLRVFVCLAETLNMRITGERLHVSQAAVSATLAALETRFDTHLFDRVGRGLVLSAAGREFLPEAQAVLTRADDARQVLHDLAGLVRGSVKIVASQTLASYWLPARIASFVSASPRIEVTLVATNTAHAIQDVVTGQADLGFIEGKVSAEQIEATRVGEDTMGLYVAASHPLAQATADLHSLRQLPWVVREPGSGTREHLEQGLQQLGIDPTRLNIRLALPSNEAVLEALGVGGMIAGVPDIAAASRLSTGAIVRLNCDLPPRTFSLILHESRRRSRAVATFIEAIR